MKNNILVKIAYNKVKLEVPNMSKEDFDNTKPDMAEVENTLYIKFKGNYVALSKGEDDVYRLPKAI